MIRALLLASLGLWFCAGCKKKASEEAKPEPPAKVEPEPPAEVVATVVKIEKLAADVCTCKTHACIEDVEKSAVGLDPDPHLLSYRTLRSRVDAASMKAQGCTLAIPPDAPKPVAPPAPADPAAALPKRTGEVMADELIRDTKTWVAANMADVVVQSVRANYVRKDGTLDGSYGELTIEFGVPEHATEIVDDPKRPTGAPIPAAEPAVKRDRCPRFVFAKGTWKSTLTSCTKRDGIKGPRCSPAEIWKRALAQGAPGDAVAVLRTDTYNRDRWQFSINDPLRKVSFLRTIPDDCEVQVEGKR